MVKQGPKIEKTRFDEKEGLIEFQVDYGDKKVNHSFIAESFEESQLQEAIDKELTNVGVDELKKQEARDYEGKEYDPKTKKFK
tara:strand:+ start:8936 stop:9184 length:249 start_codon:yes stop_codon:yes gene_type:complete